MADNLVARMRARFSSDSADKGSVYGIQHLVDLALGSRNPGAPHPPLVEAGIEFPSIWAANAVVRQVNSSGQTSNLFDHPAAERWRHYDSSAFCDLAVQFHAEYVFAVLSGECLAMNLNVDEECVRRFSREAALITRSFSARWYNACARYVDPERGSVRWYWRHCLGKLDLELERERSDWIEANRVTGKKMRARSPRFEF